MRGYYERGDVDDRIGPSVRPDVGRPGIPEHAHSRATMRGGSMRGYYMHHGGNGFLIRMAVGERTIDVLSPQTCAECGSLVDPELGAKHRTHCTVSDETMADLQRPRRQLGDGS